MVQDAPAEAQRGQKRVPCFPRLAPDTLPPTSSLSGLSQRGHTGCKPQGSLRKLKATSASLVMAA